MVIALLSEFIQQAGLLLGLPPGPLKAADQRSRKGQGFTDAPLLSGEDERNGCRQTTCFYQVCSHISGYTNAGGHRGTSRLYKYWRGF